MNNQPQEAIEHNIKWDGRNIRLSYKPQYLSGLAHIAIHTENREPLPITKTGYKSHFFYTNDPPSIEDIECLVLDWLHEDAKSNSWCEYVVKSKQMELF